MKGWQHGGLRCARRLKSRVDELKDDLKYSMKIRRGCSYHMRYWSGELTMWWDVPGHSGGSKFQRHGSLSTDSYCSMTAGLYSQMCTKAGSRAERKIVVVVFE